MHFLRKQTLKNLTKKRTKKEENDKHKIPYKDSVLSNEKIIKKLPSEIAKKFKEIIDRNMRMTIDVADILAHIFKEWAIEKKVFHFTHWFQPLTGQMAEKSQNFMIITENSKINALCGESLIMQETDGSSFPHGGLRSTFEARGYIIWDPKSSPFILNNSLCIPSILISFNEEALDFKTPLIRATEFVENAALKLTKLFFPETKYVKSYLGWEQEFFLVDKSILLARPDLHYTGKAIIGSKGTQNQEMTGHYFGKIPTRVLNYMTEVETMAYRLGIPIKTRHNEVAPNQFEFSYFYAETCLAVDHNQLFMEIMKQMADKHDLHVIFHEKPFNHYNGSGKHCNFSFMTDTGLKLYQKSTSPDENLLFLCFLAATISGINKNGCILNESISSYKNDQRLGGHEAPPCILSIFLGDELHDFLVSKIHTGRTKSLTILSSLPNILLDAHDRNRTSPFAYNVNRFEFRSVGSSANCAEPMTAVFTVIGNELNEIYDELKKSTDGQSFPLHVVEVINKFVQSSRNVLFNGDGYSTEWVNEAKRRNLAHFKHCPDAIKQILVDEFMEIYVRNNIFDKNEIKARSEVKLKQFVEHGKNEYQILMNFVNQYVKPSIERYLMKLLKIHSRFSANKIESNDLKQRIHECEKMNQNLIDLQNLLVERMKMFKNDTRNYFFFAEQIIPLFNEIGNICDLIEEIVPDDKWNILKVEELLYLY